jgi:hypothetical protein
MSRRPSTSPVALVRRQRRELRELMAHVSAVARQRMAEAIAEGLFDEPTGESQKPAPVRSPRR